MFRNHYLLWMAWRQLVSKKGQGLSFMTAMSLLGVAIGVAALVIVLSVMGGFERDLRRKMFDGMPHLEVQAENALAGFSLKERPLASFRELVPQALTLEPFTKSDVILKNNKHVASVTLYGIQPELGGQPWGFDRSMSEGTLEALQRSEVQQRKGGASSEPGIILGEGLAIMLAVDIGDTVDLLSPQASSGSVLTGAKLSSTFRVVGYFHAEQPRSESRLALVTLGEGRKFLADYDYSLDEEEYVSGVALTIKDPDAVDSLKQLLESKTDLKALSWKQANSSLLYALKLEKYTMGSILFLIVLVATFSISGTMMMTVFNRRPQVALLCSLGMSQRHIARLFLLHGSIIGAVGVLSGLAVGLSVCTVLYYFQFIELPSGMYYQKNLPVIFLPVEYAVISLCAMLLSLLAALYPGLVASKQDPGTGLRFT